MSTVIGAIIAATGVAIGGFLTQIGNYINQRLKAQQEQKKWENQHEAEKAAWNRDELSKERENLKETYQQSLRALSLFLAFLASLDGREINSKDEQRQLQLVDNVFKWVTLLQLRHNDAKLNDMVTHFAHQQRWDTAQEIKALIVDLSKLEKGFFLNDEKNQVENVEKIDPDIRTITIDIDADYRKKELIAGVEIPKNYTFDYRLSKMTSSQREKLVDIYFSRSGLIPKKLKLSLLPITKTWEAKLNPIDTEPKDILVAWEKDYERSLGEVK